MFSQLAGKATFVNYLPRLTQATSDDGDPTPGYLFDEITKITFHSSSSCHQLVDYLIHRLNKSSTTVKIKVLKIIVYVINNGHVSFRQELRQHDGSLKNASVHSGPADPLLGNTLYKDVQNLAQETLDLLFNPETMKEEETNADVLASLEPAAAFMSGMGSSARSTGKYEGFGNSIKEKEGTVANKMLDYFGRLINSTEEQTSEVIRAALHSSPGDYQPVAVAGTLMDPVFTTPLPTPKTSFVKHHVPGRAGGGWESDEDENDEETHNQMRSEAISEVPLADLQNDGCTSFQQPKSDHLSEDEPLLAVQESLEKFCKMPGLPSIDELDEVCTKCVTFGYMQSLSALSKICYDPPTISHNEELMRILLLLEWLYHQDCSMQQRIAKDAEEILVHVVKDPSLPATCRSKANKLKFIFKKTENSV